MLALSIAPSRLLIIQTHNTNRSQGEMNKNDLAAFKGNIAVGFSVCKKVILDNVLSEITSILIDELNKRIMMNIFGIYDIEIVRAKPLRHIVSIYF